MPADKPRFDEMHRTLFEQQFNGMVPAILGPIANSLERREDGLYKQIAVEALFRGFQAALMGTVPASNARTADAHLSAEDLERLISKAKAEEKAHLDALAVAILGWQYTDRHRQVTHVGCPPEFTKWANERMGHSYDPTCQYPVKAIIEGGAIPSAGAERDYLHDDRFTGAFIEHFTEAWTDEQATEPTFYEDDTQRLLGYAVALVQDLTGEPFEQFCKRAMEGPTDGIEARPTGPDR
jgi:hypothetical protein